VESKEIHTKLAVSLTCLSTSNPQFFSQALVVIPQTSAVMLPLAGHVMTSPKTLRRPGDVQVNVEAQASCQLGTYMVLKEEPIDFESAEQASVRGK
jgi:hypothetical protein